MRWTKRIWVRGDRRVRSGFLLIPRSITIERHGIPYRERRWLEYAAWEEEYWTDPTGDSWDTTKWMYDNEA